MRSEHILYRNISIDKINQLTEWINYLHPEWDLFSKSSLGALHQTLSRRFIHSSTVAEFANARLVKVNSFC